MCGVDWTCECGKTAQTDEKFRYVVCPCGKDMKRKGDKEERGEVERDDGDRSNWWDFSEKPWWR